MNKVINNIMSTLDGKLSEQDLLFVKTALIFELDKYDITLKEKSLVPWELQLPDCYKAYMVTKKLEGLSQLTLRLYQIYIEDLLRFVAKPIENVNQNDIRRYLYRVQEERGLSNRTLDSRRAALSSFFAWCASEGYLPGNPMLSVRPIKYNVLLPEPLTDIQLESVRYHCNTIREKAIVEFMYSTGCRVSELVHLNKNDINYQTGEVTLFGKGSKYRTSWLSPKALLYLREYYSSRTDENNAVIVSERHPHGRVGNAAIRKIIHDIGIRANVPELHPHQIRHTTATNALAHGMDITQVQKLLGHVNINTTMIYAKVDTSALQGNCRKYIS